MLLGGVPGCGSRDKASAPLRIDVGSVTPLVTRVAGLIEDCYRDGSEPEICTSGSLRAVTKVCEDLPGQAAVGLADVEGAITVYPADNPRYGEVSCLFATPRASLSVELWRRPLSSLCSADGGFQGSCAPLAHGLEVGRRSDLPSISVAGDRGRVVTAAASPALDAVQLVAIAKELTKVVFDVAVSNADLAKVQDPSAKPS